MRSTYYEASCRIYEYLYPVVHPLRRDDRLYNVFDYVFSDLLKRNVRIVLSRNEDCIYTVNITLFIVLYSYLSLTVRSEIRQSSVLTDVSEFLCKLVRKHDRSLHA